MTGPCVEVHASECDLDIAEEGRQLALDTSPVLLGVDAGSVAAMFEVTEVMGALAARLCMLVLPYTREVFLLHPMQLPSATIAVHNSRRDPAPFVGSPLRRADGIQ